MRYIFLLLIIFFIVACTTVNNESEGTEPELHSLSLEGINKITITEVGVKSIAGKDINISCENFTLTQNDIEEYFNMAKKINKNDYRHMLDWSPCYVKGSIILNNGDTGEWGIHQYRGGTVTFGADETIYMYCPGCTAKKFDAPEYFSN